MIRRTASGKAKKGMTLSQLRRQACAMAGYFRPQGPESKASSAALPASASFAVDHAQRRHDRLSIFPRDELQRMPDQMHDAGLDDRLREDGVDRFGESLQAIDNGDENVADAPVPEFVHDAQPEL